MHGDTGVEMTEHGGYPPPGQAYPPPGHAYPPPGQVTPGHPTATVPGAAPAFAPGAAPGVGYPAAPAYAMPVLHKPGIVALRPLGLGDVMDGSIKAIRRNPGATLGLSALVTLACLIPSAILSSLVTMVSVPIVLVVGGGILLALNGHTAAGLLVGVLGGLPCLAGAIWLSTRTALAAPTIVLEGAGVRSGLRRSFALTRGAFWRTFGIILLVSVIAQIAGSMLAAPFSLLGIVGMAATGDNMQSGLVMLVIASHLGRIVSGTLTTPFTAGVVGLLYIDRRIRLEGLDVTLIRAAAADAAGRRG